MTWSCSTSIFMEKRAQAWARAIRRVGRRWWPNCSSNRSKRFPRRHTFPAGIGSRGAEAKKTRRDLLHSGAHLLIRNQAVKDREHLFAVVIHPLQILAEGGFEVRCFHPLVYHQPRDINILPEF